MAEDRNGFWLLAAGALLFAAAFLIGNEWLRLGDSETANPPLLLGLCTIAFGLPYAAREILARRTNWLLVLFLLVLIPLAHALAAYVFMGVSAKVGEAAAAAAEAALNADPASMEMAPATPTESTTPKMFIGLAAGAAGALVPLLAAGLLPWLRKAGVLPWPFLAGLLALAWWGAMGLRLADDTSAYDLVVTLFLPWQALFAFVLAYALKPSPRKDVPAL